MTQGLATGIFQPFVKYIIFAIVMSRWTSEGRNSKG